MQKIFYILPLIFFIIITGCSEDSLPDYKQEKSVQIKLMQQTGFTTKLIDEDNLESEQFVKNISVFFTEPSSNVVTDKFIYSGFTTVDDYKLITLPLDAATLQTKDIYIVANYDTINKLNAVATIQDIQALTTTWSDKNNLLLPENGFCMYGSTLGFNFNDGSNTPAVVNLVRTCAKIRINLTFPENPTLSTDNSFLIANAANYTYLVQNNEVILPLTDYFTYAAPLPLTNDGTGKYTGITYIYEASQAPKLYIYSHINNSTAAQEYSADLPNPWRNHLYNIDVMIYEKNATTTGRTLKNATSQYSYKTTITVYNSKGEIVH